MATEKSPITLKTLKAGAAALGIDISEAKNVKAIAKLIDEHYSDQDLEYECPSCKKDIPDVEACPYCGETFDSEDGDSDSEEDGASDVEEEEVVEEVAKAVAGKNGKGKDKGKGGKGKEVKEEAAEEEEEAAEEEEEAPKKSNKKADEKPAKSGKGKEVKKEVAEEEEGEDTKSSKGRPAGKTKNTEEKEAQFTELIENIDNLAGDFEKRERKTGVTYVKDKKRLLKAVSVSKTISIEFNVELTADVDGLAKYTADEAKEKHLGSTTAVYSFGDLKTAMKLVKEAIKNFG